VNLGNQLAYGMPVDIGKAPTNLVVTNVEPLEVLYPLFAFSVSNAIFDVSAFDLGLRCLMEFLSSLYCPASRLKRRNNVDRYGLFASLPLDNLGRLMSFAYES